jgi:hypothetical protein
LWPAFLVKDFAVRDIPQPWNRRRPPDAEWLCREAIGENAMIRQPMCDYPNP